MIDEGPVGALQLAVVIQCGLVVALEGFDAQAISYVAPSLAHDWHLRPGVWGRPSPPGCWRSWAAHCSSPRWRIGSAVVPF